MAGARVRRLTEGDIDRAIALTDLEHWGYTRADFLRLLALNRKGCFAAEDRGKLVGLLSTTVYGDLAFLGAVIVDPERRGEGIGDAMMREALQHLESSGVRTVRLNAYSHVVRFYERLGFRREYENIRWQGELPLAGPSTARRVSPTDFARLVALDAWAFGASREALLDSLRKEFRKTFLGLTRRGDVVGYIVGNTSSPDCEIGPWIVAPDAGDAAADLLQGLVGVARGRSYALTAPTPNRSSQEYVRSLGFHEVFRTLRMYRGDKAYDGRTEGVWALAGLEKG